MMNLHLQSAGPGLYFVEGQVRFFGVSIVTRTSIVELSDGGLLVCSPLPASEELAEVLEPLGEVRFVLSPNKIHNQGLSGFAKRYPNAELWASPGLPERRPDLLFAGTLGDAPEPAWVKDLDQLTTDGNVFFSEVVLFHRASRTLIVADLVENISAQTFHAPTGRVLCKMMRIYGRILPSPEFRMYTTDAEAARAKMLRMYQWPFESILMAHGDPITDDAHDAFMKVIEHLYQEASGRSPRRRALYESFAKRQ